MAYQETRREFLIKAGFSTAGVVLFFAGISTSGCKSNESSAQDSKPDSTNFNPYNNSSPRYIQAELNRLEVQLRQKGKSSLQSSLDSISKLAAGHFCGEYQGHYPDPLSPFKLYSSIDFESKSDYQQNQQSLTELLDCPSITTDPISYTDRIKERIHFNVGSFDIQQNNPLAHIYGDLLMEYHHLAAPRRSSSLLIAPTFRRFLGIHLTNFDKGLVAYTTDRDGDRYYPTHADIEDLVVVQSTRKLLDTLNLPFRIHRDIDIATFNKFVDQFCNGDIDIPLRYQQSSEYNPIFEKYYQLAGKSD